MQAYGAEVTVRTYSLKHSLSIECGHGTCLCNRTVLTVLHEPVRKHGEKAPVLLPSDQAPGGIIETSPLTCREYLDQALKALDLSKDHMQLFRQDRSHTPDDTAGQAVNALDQLLDALAGSQQVLHFLSLHHCLQQLDQFKYMWCIELVQDSDMMHHLCHVTEQPCPLYVNNVVRCVESFKHDSLIKSNFKCLVRIINRHAVDNWTC